MTASMKFKINWYWNSLGGDWSYSKHRFLKAINNCADVFHFKAFHYLSLWSNSLLGSPDQEILTASEKGKSDVVENLLLKSSSLVSAHDRDGYTPLHRACYSNHVKIAEVRFLYLAMNYWLYELLFLSWTNPWFFLIVVRHCCTFDVVKFWLIFITFRFYLNMVLMWMPKHVMVGLRYIQPASGTTLIVLPCCWIMDLRLTHSPMEVQ